MRKIIALVVGLLMLGGMMGMVSAFTPTVDGYPTDWALSWNSLGACAVNTWYGPNNITSCAPYNPGPEYAWVDSSTDTWSSQNGGAYDNNKDLLTFQVTSDTDYVYFMVELVNASQTELLILVDNDNNAATGGNSITVFGQQITTYRGWEVAITVDTTQNPDQALVYIYAQGSIYPLAYDLTAVGGDFAVVNGSQTAPGAIEIKVPKTISIPQFGKFTLFSDSSVALTVATISTVEDTIGIASGTANKLFSTNYETVDISAVPFFSDAGIAAVTLLLVLGAVWFFRRQ